MTIVKFSLISATIIYVLTSASMYGQVFPRVKTFSPPSYPPAAVAVRAEGEVAVSVEVDENGRMLSATAINGHPLLRRAAENSVKNWTFSSVQGSHFLTLRIIFRLPAKAKKTQYYLHGYKLIFTERRTVISQTVSYQEETSK